jgi:hypothetical protein
MASGILHSSLHPWVKTHVFRAKITFLLHAHQGLKPGMKNIVMIFNHSYSLKGTSKNSED